MTAVVVVLLAAAAVIAVLAVLALHSAERQLRSSQETLDRARDIADDTTAAIADSAGMDALLVERLRERFILTLTTGETFGGLLEQVDDRTVVLRNASSIGADGSEVPADGEVLLRRESIAYMQRP